MKISSPSDRKITTEILVAYLSCPWKAYQLLFSNEKGTPNKYSQILQSKKEANQKSFIDNVQQKGFDVQSYSPNGLKSGRAYLTDVTLCAENLEASCGLLSKSKVNLPENGLSYEPVIFTGTQTIEKEDKFELMFAGYLLGKLQKKTPERGTIISTDNKACTVRLDKSKKLLAPVIGQMQEWLISTAPEKPLLILNRHCQYCQFQSICAKAAEESDNLSLLSNISTLKQIRNYERKGIFTTKQLSYLFKPRKLRKDIKALKAVTHKIELQALAIRTGNIYLQQTPQITRKPVELFLDIEGIPDRQKYYLLGLLVCDGNTESYCSFWADTDSDESKIWYKFIEKIRHYPEAPIYHYGDYDLKAIKKISQRYGAEQDLTPRMINVNGFIFGKVYFPVRSNGLKDIGRFLGASWSAPNSSGLQSLIWRHYWETTADSAYKQLLTKYNEEDCRALKLLTDELSTVDNRPEAVTSFVFTRQSKRSPPKLGLTKNDNPLHQQLNTILNFSYSKYDKNKISFRNHEPSENTEKSTWTKKGYEGQRKKKPRPSKIVEVPPGEHCPKHLDQPVRPTKYISKRLIIDLVFTKNGIRKTIIEYVGQQGYCPKCERSHAPPGIRKFGRCQLYGDNFKAWYSYQRVALRMTYQGIADLIEEQFGEKIPAGSTAFIRDTALKYAETDALITQQLLKSSVVHADETTINIYGATQYVWVFTTGKYVIFKLKKSREATIAHELLDDYHGVLISDFYPGYDSVKCRQQKCWVHLIRDLNNDLWQNPYDSELEQLILEIKMLFVPMMEAVQKYGLKKRHLNKFQVQVEKFYKKFITDRQYKSESVSKYQKRFERYRQSLFTFLELDDIPWHNNPAESAIRHLAKQRDVSGSLREEATHHYLVLLGIRQTCRFQNKSFLKFLLSGEKDIDKFKGSRR